MVSINQIGQHVEEIERKYDDGRNHPMATFLRVVLEIMYVY